MSYKSDVIAYDADSTPGLLSSTEFKYSIAADSDAFVAAEGP